MTEPNSQEYYAIIGGYTGKVIGACHRDSFDDVLNEEPGATFKPISKDEFDRYGDEPETLKYLNSQPHAQPAEREECHNHFSDGSKIFPDRECQCSPQPPQAAPELCVCGHESGEHYDCDPIRPIGPCLHKDDGKGVVFCSCKEFRPAPAATMSAEERAKEIVRIYWGTRDPRNLQQLSADALAAHAAEQTAAIQYKLEIQKLNGQVWWETMEAAFGVPRAEFGDAADVMQRIRALRASLAQAEWKLSEVHFACGELRRANERVANELFDSKVALVNAEDLLAESERLKLSAVQAKCQAEERAAKAERERDEFRESENKRLSIYMSRTSDLEAMLSEWVKPCFCNAKGTCLMCETRILLNRQVDITPAALQPKREEKP